VLPPEYNDKYELMSKLGVDKIEVLINERCVPNCPNRQAHYAAISRSQLSRDPGFQENCYRSHCPVYHASMEDRQVETMELSDRKISALQKLGVHNFKFAGRQLYRDRFIREVDSILVKQKYRPYTLHEAG
jgi:collagenase-like PrtC family protease